MAATKAAKKPVPLALVPHQWQPGQSGNPRGVLAAPKYLDCLRICREASSKAAETLIALLEDEDSRVRLMAADKILERAWGKPREMTDEPNEAEAETKRAEILAQVFRMLEERAAERAGNTSSSPNPETGTVKRSGPRSVELRSLRQQEQSPPSPAEWE
jgi:hypothetical protein